MSSPLVSVIMPVYNAALWLEQSLGSVLHQTFDEAIEISVFDDGSTDNSLDILRAFQRTLENDENFSFILSTSSYSSPKGCGYAKNQAILQSSGSYLCFLDSDDIMDENRIKELVEVAREVDKNHDHIIGSKFHRKPEGSTARFTTWANGLSHKELYNQIFTSHGPTLIMPTWFCHKHVWEKVKGFPEDGSGTPEDLVFFYKHLDNNGKLFKVEKDLLMYRYHPQQTTFSVSEEVIWEIRLQRLENTVLKKWKEFTIWNAGKQGRRLYRSLSLENQKKVVCLCDVDENKIRKKVYTFEETNQLPKPKIPICHFKNAKPPFVICVKLGLSQGDFERNLAELRLKEGIDYYHFG